MGALRLYIIIRHSCLSLLRPEKSSRAVVVCGRRLRILICSIFSSA